MTSHNSILHDVHEEADHQHSSIVTIIVDNKQREIHCSRQAGAEIKNVGITALAFSFYGAMLFNISLIYAGVSSRRMRFGF